MTLDTLNQKISQCQQQIAEKDVLASRYGQLETEIQNLQSKIEALSEQLVKENRDVEKLESFTLQSLWAKITNTQVEKLDKERQEALKAEWAYDQARQSLRLMQADLGTIRSKLKILETAAQDFEKLLEQKLELLLQQGNNQSIELKQEYADLQQNRRTLVETEEAIIAAKAYFDCVGQLVRDLSSAHTWGTWDLIGGRGITSVIKHQQIDKARQSISTLHYHKHRLTLELKDLNLPLNTTLEIDKLEYFTDIFFDNIITDWSVYSKVNRSLDQAQDTHKQLHALIMQLAHQKSTLTHRLATEENKIRNQIINS